MNPAAGRLKSSHSSTTTSQLSIQRITLQTSFLSSIRSEFGLALSSCARMLPIASSSASAGSVMSMLSWQRSVNCPTRCSCAGILTTLHSARISKRKSKLFETMEVFSPMKQMIPLKKQSKKAQKEQHAKQRGSWYGICPITRTVPNGKAYDRNRVKREDRDERALRIEENCASARMTRSCALSQESMCLMPAISITALMVTRCSIQGSTSNIPRTVIASGG